MNHISLNPDSKVTNETLGVLFRIEGGNSGLTEDIIYENQPTSKEESINILSSATVESKMMGPINKNAKINGEPLILFSGPCIIVARNGTFAGAMTYVPTGEFTTTDHAYVLTLKPKWEDKVDLRWFVFQYQELFYSIVTAKGSNATFNKELAKSQTIILPDPNVQNKVADRYELQIGLKKKIDHFMDRITSQINASMEIGGRHKIINDVFNLTVGSDDQMTEQYAYNNEGNIPIYSGASQNNGILQYTNRIDYNPPDEYITWSLSGKAGTMYLRKGPCCLTRDCGIMIPKNKDEVNLKWFILTQEKSLQEFAIGKGGLGRLKKILAKLYPFVLPPRTVQDLLVKEQFEPLIELKDKLGQMNQKIDLLLEKRINDYENAN